MFHYFLSIQVTGAYLVLIVVMFFFCLFMFRQNKFLKNELEKLKRENEAFVLSQNKIKISNCNKDIDTVPIQKISEEIVEKVEKKVSDKKVSNNKNVNKNVSVDKNNKKENRLYSGNKNALSNKKQVTSPVFIDNDVFDMDKLSFDLNEFIKKEKKVVPKIKENVTSSDYLQEISDKLSGEIESKTIELTDYEKKQEESAIISYQELLNVKDRLQTVDDEDETVDFLEELKSFRNSLN